MANSWGELAWGTNNWGEQSNVTVEVTGLGGNPIAWGNSSFGSTSFGGTSTSIPLSLSEETVTGEINAGWGRLTWGENAWGIQGDVLVNGVGLDVGAGVGTINAGAGVFTTGEQQNLNTGSVQAFGLAQVPVTGNQLNISQGDETIDLVSNFSLTGIQLNANLGTVDSYNEAGWGRDDWGTEVWGAQGIWETVTVSGESLGVSSGEQEAWGELTWGTYEWGGISVTDVDILTIASPTGIELTAAEGTVDPSPDATVVGIGLSASVAVGSVVEADANVTTTGNQVNIAQGQAELDAVTFANVTGQQLNTTLNSIVAGASAEIFPTGIQSNLALGNINIQSWQIVDTGTTVSYTEVSTGTSVTWNDIDTAA